ncbi:MAG: flap endonuclease-1 [Candidatus Nanoarchaeia archaeon]|nr:flap endonuclease-1 [Candidatus Nanoarchaeia archaeon]
MGLKITDLVHRKELKWEDLKNKKIAVDSSQMLYQFATTIRQSDGTPLMDNKGRITSHLMGLMNRIPNLMEKQIKLVFVFDGKPPILKLTETEDREHKKRLAEEKLQQAKQEEDIEGMYKYSRQTVRITKEMSEDAKELIKAFGLPVIQAPSEAEAQASFMAEKGDVYGVSSSDYDCLVYGTPRLIYNLTSATKKKLKGGGYVNVYPEMIELSEVLNDLGISQDQLLVLAILTGTDYNKGGVKGIGPKTALKLVKQHKNFDEIFKEVKAEFNWKEIYAVFKSMPIMKNYQIKWNEPDSEKIKKILVDEHEFNEERVDSVLEKLEKREKGQKGLFDFGR